MIYPVCQSAITAWGQIVSACTPAIAPVWNAYVVPAVYTFGTWGHHWGHHAHHWFR